LINVSPFFRPPSYRTLKVFVFFIFLLVVGQFCCAKSLAKGNSKPIDYYWKTVEEMYRTDHLNASMKLAEEGLRKYPADIKLLKLKAIIQRDEAKAGQFPPHQRIEKLNESKMLWNYKTGIKHYQAKNYSLAVRYLKRSLTINEDFVPSYFYAEANAMLGIIYQFYDVDKVKAYGYYQAALERDPLTLTALKHIKQVSPYRHRKNHKNSGSGTKKNRSSGH